MWVFDRKTLRFLAVNRAAIRQYGFTEQEFLAKTIKEIRPEEDIPNLLEDMSQHTVGLQGRGIWRHLRKNGEIIDVEILCDYLSFGGTDAILVAALYIT